MVDINPLAQAFATRQMIQADRERGQQRQRQEEQRSNLGTLNALMMGGQQRNQPGEAMPGFPQQPTNINAGQKASEFAMATGDPEIMQFAQERQAQLGQQEREQFAQQAEMAGSLLGDLMRIPMAQRQQVLASPQFQQRAAMAGYAPQMLASFQPTDENIQMELAEVGQLRQQMAGGDVPDSFRTLQLRAINAGLEPGSPEYQAFMRQGGGREGSLVNVYTGPQGEDAFRNVLAETEAEQFAGFLEAGNQASRNMVNINRLEELLGQVDTGGRAAIQAIAGDFGINTDGLSDVQAARALINSMVPDQRPPGSGPMSDADLELFKQSLPRIINQPGGNELIIDTLRGIARYDMQLGRISQAVLNEQIDRTEARRRVAALQNPIDAIRRQTDGSGNRQQLQARAAALGVEDFEDVLYTARQRDMSPEQVLDMLEERRGRQ